MKTISQSIICVLVLVLIFACSTTGSRGQDKQDEEIVNIEPVDSVEVLREMQVVSETELDGKTFYYLENNSLNELILKRFEDDFEMKKYIFESDRFINGKNVMEPSEWDVIKKSKRDSSFIYIVSMIGNDDWVDTLRFQLWPSKGFLFRTIREGVEPIILIDSEKTFNVKIIQMDSKYD